MESSFRLDGDIDLDILRSSKTVSETPTEALKPKTDSMSRSTRGDSDGHRTHSHLRPSGTHASRDRGNQAGPTTHNGGEETLSGDLRAGIWTAAAPIFTDGPLIVVSYLFASILVDKPSILVLISILGALFMFKMGVECFSIEPPTLSSMLEPASSKKAFGGVLTNLLNPNVYVFWFLIGGPIMASAVALDPLAPLAYAVTFIIGIILVKCLIAIMLHRMRDAMPRHIYKSILSLCGVAMIIFALGYLAFAWSQYQSI